MNINYVKHLNDGSLKIGPIGFWKAFILSFAFDFILSFTSIPTWILTDFITGVNDELSWFIDSISYVISFIQQYGAIIIVIILINRGFKTDDIKLYEDKITRRKHLAGIGMIIAYIFITYGTFDMFLYSLPTFNEGLYEFLEEYLISTPYIFIFIETCIMAPIFEEILYRGVFLNGLLNKYKYNHKKAIILSSILFGIVHLNLPQGLNAFLLGIIIGFAYYCTRSIYVCIAMHFANNFLVNFVFYSESELWTTVLFILIPIIGIIIMLKSIKVIKIKEEM